MPAESPTASDHPPSTPGSTSSGPASWCSLPIQRVPNQCRPSRGPTREDEQLVAFDERAIVKRQRLRSGVGSHPAGNLCAEPEVDALGPEGFLEHWGSRGGESTDQAEVGSSGEFEPKRECLAQRDTGDIPPPRTMRRIVAEVAPAASLVHLVGAVDWRTQRLRPARNNNGVPGGPGDSSAIRVPHFDDTGPCDPPASAARTFPTPSSHST